MFAETTLYDEKIHKHNLNIKLGVLFDLECDNYAVLLKKLCCFHQSTYF